MIDKTPDLFIAPFQIELYRNDLSWIVKIPAKTILIILKEKSVTKEALLDLEDYSNKNLSNWTITIPENRIKPTFDKAILEVTLTNKIKGFKLLRPNTNQFYWISHYDLNFLITKINYTQKLEDTFLGKI